MDDELEEAKAGAGRPVRQLMQPIKEDSDDGGLNEGSSMKRQRKENREASELAKLTSKAPVTDGMWDREMSEAVCHVSGLSHT